METKVELVDAIPKLKSKYESSVLKFIQMNLITLDEWNKRFKNYRDSFGYSIIHYLECSINNIDRFVTYNPIMLKNREELQKRFKIKIVTPEELLKEAKRNDR